MIEATLRNTKSAISVTSIIAIITIFGFYLSILVSDGYSLYVYKRSASYKVHPNVSANKKPNIVKHIYVN